MKKYIYPVVLYYDHTVDGYAVAVHDLNIFSEAESVEEAYSAIKDYIKRYFEFLKETKEDIPQSSKFIDVYRKENEDNIVLLVGN